MLGGYVIQSYRTVVPAFDTLAGATWYSWTADHVPLAGQTDWAGIGIAGVAASRCSRWASRRSRGETWE